MFSIDDRDRLRDDVLAMAAADSRVVGGAVLGSLAHDEGDRWSDLDLMFAVADGAAVSKVRAEYENPPTIAAPVLRHQALSRHSWLVSERAGSRSSSSSSTGDPE